jgi:hypothetical protein
MELLDKNTELIDFINHEKCNDEINVKRAYIYFNTCCVKTILELSSKFNSHSQWTYMNEVVKGTKMFSHVFFILLSYTNNLKLTIFLSERAVLLFTEFIIMSNDNKFTKDLCYFPNINDAVMFAYKKTIGSLVLKNATVKPNIKYIRTASSIIKLIYLEYFKFNPNLTSKNMEFIDTMFSFLLLSLFNKYSNQEVQLSKQIIGILSHYKNMYKFLYLKIVLELMLNHRYFETGELLDPPNQEYTLKLKDLSHFKSNKLYKNIKSQLKL